MPEPAKDVATMEMEQTITHALMGHEVAVPADAPEKAVEAPPEEKPVVEAPVAKPVEAAAPSAVEQTQAQLDALAKQMDRLVGTLADQQRQAGEKAPTTKSALAELAADPKATEEARLVAQAILDTQESIAKMHAMLESTEQARWDEQYEAEKSAFAVKYPGFSKADVEAIDRAFGDATEKQPGIETLTFEEFAARHLGGYDGLLARRAPAKEPKVVPGGKGPAKIIGESATGGGRASLGKPLDRHASQDDVTARLTASLTATR